MRRGWVAHEVNGRAVAFGAVWAILALVFVALPWSIETKALAALHGLCAQQPSHSLYFGDQRLPFDARMTGIYGGFAVAAGVLLVRGRWRAAGIPRLGITLTLVAGIAMLAIDGINSTLVDAGLPYAYAPRNTLRLVTGLFTGSALAVFVFLLIGQVGFAKGGRRPGAPLAGWRDLGIVIGVQSAAALMVLSRWPPLRVPITMVLMGSAILALSGLMLAFVLLLGRRECCARSNAELAGPATLALVGAIILIGSLAAGRFLLEAWLGLPVQG